MWSSGKVNTLGSLAWDMPSPYTLSAASGAGPEYSQTGQGRDSRAKEAEWGKKEETGLGSG